MQYKIVYIVCTIQLWWTYTGIFNKEKDKETGLIKKKEREKGKWGG